MEQYDVIIVSSGLAGLTSAVELCDHGAKAPPEKFLAMEKEEILKQVQKEARELGLDLETNLTKYRIVSRPEDFYSLEPNHDRLRPNQKTDIDGLILAGDYTKQPYYATMEGAVVSGLKAASLVLNNVKK